ncbi:MAG: hypothetical protein R3D55_01725 [Chloroflexota bacterium]
MIEIGFHTDAFNSSYWNFEHCLQWAQKNDVHYIECGTIDGVSWLHGLGYQPHVALWEDPVALRKKMDSYGVQFSQLDAAYPLFPTQRRIPGHALHHQQHSLGLAGGLHPHRHHRPHAQASRGNR